MAFLCKQGEFHHATQISEAIKQLADVIKAARADGLIVRLHYKNELGVSEVSLVVREDTF